jgi:hypothetical protein
MMATWLLALVLAAETTGTRSAEDDLALVKKAVAKGSPTVVAQDAAGTKVDPPAREAPRATVRNGKEPQWFKVRVSEKKGTKGTKVSVNLPLALVRAMGEDWPLDIHCGRACGAERHSGKDRVRLTLGDVLRALDSGQDLVQVDDEDATVRVWVE